MKIIILFLFCFSVVVSQDKPTYASVSLAGTATTALQKFSTGHGEKDVTIVNFNTGTDTLIVCTFIMDTAAAYWSHRMLLLPGWTNNKLQKFGGDTLYILSSGTSHFYIEATKR